MKPNDNVQLFMLHFAGGNSFSFNFLKPHLPLNIAFHPLELPGRGKRSNEKLIETDSEAIEDLVSQIISRRNNKPYLIFGHSMGATFGLRVTKRLEEMGDRPKKLIVAGNAGPKIGNDKKKRSKMNDEDLKEELRTLGGINEEVLNNEDLFNFFAPIMRSDFSLLENSEESVPNFKITVPIVAIMGDQEEHSSQIDNWKNFTSNEFKSYLLPGHHFFIHDCPADLMEIIKNSYGRPLVF